MKRPSRIAALLALLALLFSQLAVSAYACPLQAPAAIEVQAHAEMPVPCDQGADSNLCERHCDYGSANVGSFDLHFPAPVVVAWVLPVAPVQLARDLPMRHPSRVACTHSPPPLLLFGTLRI